MPLEEDDCHIVDLVALAESKSKVFPSEAFHLVNDELVDILLKAGDIIYNEKEIKDSLGQYVFIFSGNMTQMILMPMCLKMNCEKRRMISLLTLWPSCLS